MNDHGVDFEDEPIDACAHEHRRSPSPPPSAAYYVKIVALLLTLFVGMGFVIVRSHNSFIAPLLEAFAEQDMFLRNNTVNFNRKCIDPAVKAAFGGFDGCLAHETNIKAGYYYPAMQRYLRKIDPCSDKGCLHVEMNFMSLLVFVVPLVIGLSALLFVVVMAFVLMALWRALSARYELPDRMPSYGYAPPAAAKRRPDAEQFTYPPQVHRRR